MKEDTDTTITLSINKAITIITINIINAETTAANTTTMKTKTPKATKKNLKQTIIRIII